MTLNNIGIVGVTGLVGETILELLENDFEHIKYQNLKLFASVTSAGKIVSCRNQKLKIKETTIEELSTCDAIIFATDSKISQKYIPELVKKGILCIDKSSAFRMQNSVPLIVPEVNWSTNLLDHKLITSPNCCATPLSIVLNSLNNKISIERCIVSTYQSVSGAGKNAVDTLRKEIQHFYSSQDFGSKPSNSFPKSIAYNVLPFVASLNDEGNTDEEEKIIQETQKILNKSIPMSVTSTRVPTFVGHCLSVTLEMSKNFELSEVFNYLNNESAIEIVDYRNTVENDNESSELQFMTPREAQGNNAIFVSRVRKTNALKNGLSLWIVADNLRKGAALNSLQILEKFF